MQSAYSWAGTAPDVVSCVRQSPTNAGPAATHPMPVTPAPLPAIPAAFVSHRPDRILLQTWGSCLLPSPSPLDASKCLCLASARGGLDWAGLGCAGSPQLSLLNVPEGPRTVTIVISIWPSQSDKQRIACLACGCRMHAGPSL